MNTFAEDAVRFERIVVCQWCNNKHRTVISDPTLGDGCATNVWQVTEATRLRLAEKGVVLQVGEWMANAHYGSNNDCTLWRWVNNFPRVEADPICDNCIGERVVAGDLSRIEGNFP